ncbi:MAG: carboxylesterase family protein [Thermoguttaceae bacterium]
MSSRWIGVLSVALLSLVLVPASAEDANRLKPGEFKAEVTTTVECNYLLYTPKDYDSKDAWPLMVFLHGAGERGDDLELLKIHGPTKLITGGKDFPCIVLAPQCPKYLWWQSEVLIKLIDKVAGQYKVDRKRIYLTGLSMGGFATWDLAAKHPQVFAAIAPICGGGDPANAKAYVGIPTWVFHGGKDSTVPLSSSEKMVEAIKAAGGDPKFTVYPDAGHDSWTATYDNPEFYTWLFQQKKSK